MKRTGIGLVFLIPLLYACVRPYAQSAAFRSQSTPSAPEMTATPHPTVRPLPFILPTRLPGDPIVSPTPDLPRTLPALRQEDEQYTVRSGDSLMRIAQQYGVDLNALIAANQLANPDRLEVGQVLTIPAPNPLDRGSDLKIIPDSELVNGPAATTLNLGEFLNAHPSAFTTYHGDVDGDTYSGEEILKRVSTEFSVNPRLLLAILEYQGQWLSAQTVPQEIQDYPLGVTNPYYRGMYKQLAFAANQLNQGYYLWKIGAISGYILKDGGFIPPALTINAGTAAVQHFFAQLNTRDGWDTAVGVSGLAKTYTALFGYPFDYSVDPLIPPDLTQPDLQLPFERGDVWSFTGGPHGGWGSGSAWAALDFAPPGDALGCVQSDAWVTAPAAGRIVRSGGGAVVLDLDEDGFEQSGWTLLLMHIESRDRIAKGSTVKAGDRIGHPSCEGGFSNGTHVHIARRYNGEWISADGTVPFVMDGWVSSGDGIEYNGWLTKEGLSVEAWDSRREDNQIGR